MVEDAEHFNSKLQEWEHFYNFERQHGALGGQTLYERLRQKTTTPGVVGHRQWRLTGASRPPPIAMGAMGGDVFETEDTHRHTFQKHEEIDHGRNAEAGA